MARRSKKSSQPTWLPPDLIPEELERTYGVPALKLDRLFADYPEAYQVLWDDVVRVASPDSARIMIAGSVFYCLPGPVVMSIQRLKGCDPLFSLDRSTSVLSNEKGCADLSPYRNTTASQAEFLFERESSRWTDWPLSYDECYDDDGSDRDQDDWYTEEWLVEELTSP